MIPYSAKSASDSRVLNHQFQSADYHKTIKQASIRAEQAFLEEWADMPLFLIRNELMAS